MKKMALLSILSILLGTSTDAMQIVENSNPKALIVVSEKAPESALYAAKELQAYLKKISGAELQIVNSIPESTDKILIYVGYDDFLKSKGLNLDGLGYDGFKIVSGDRWLALFGKDYNGKPIAGKCHPFRLSESYSRKLQINRFGETGTLFAVYRFLEEFCGVRWYMPGDLGEVAPEQRTLNLPEKINLKTTPDFEYRFLYSCDFPKDDESVLWYRRAGFGAPFPVNINHIFRSVFMKYQKSNPEYFALINGKRDFNISCQGQGNLCLSNPDVLKCFIKEAREYFDKNPEQYIFPIMPNDGLSVICECPECRKQIDKGMEAGKFSNYVWNFVNEVAKEIYKTHPDKFIGCCAYDTYTNPSLKIGNLSPNIAVMLCKTSSNYWNLEYRDRTRRWIQEWNGKLKPGNMYCWDYYCWILMVPYLNNVPVFFPRLIADDLKFLRGKCKGEFLEAEAWPLRSKVIRKLYFPGLTHLNHYITAKLMWNADTDVNKLLEEYYSKFYGPAASDMKKFWEKAEEMWCRPRNNNNEFFRIYNQPEVGMLMSLLRSARTKTADNSAERKRIDLIISEITPLEERVKRSNIAEKPSCECRYFASVPRIDGKPDDPCWNNAPWMEFVSKTGESVPDTSKAAVCFDDKKLYLFFINYFEGADTTELKALCKEKDCRTKPYIWDDESIEIFLNPTPGLEKNYYQFIINAKAVIWDGHYGTTEFKTPSEWNSKIEVAIIKNTDSWMLEVGIPLSDLGISANDMEGVTISGNFIRNSPKGELFRYSCWSPTIDLSNHNTSRFGTLTLKKNSTGKISNDGNGIYSLKNTGLPLDFVAAYECFLNAKAGDNDSYVQAAHEFRKAFEKLKGKNGRIELQCLSFDALCSYLSLDIAGARALAKEALSIAVRECPDSLLIKTLDGGNKKSIDEIENTDIRDLGKLLLAIALTEKETFTLSEKLTDKRKILLRNVDLKEEWENTALIISVLLEKIAPSFQLVDEKVRQAVCVCNLRQLGVMLFLYAQEHEGKLPLPWNAASKTIWMQEILKTQKERGTAFRCPSLLKKGKNGYHYGINSILMVEDTEKVLQGNKIILLSDSVHYNLGDYPYKPNYGGAAYSVKGPYESTGGGTVDRHRHLGGANVLFSDGSVEWLPASRISADFGGPLWKNW